jgi:hypothetical protein
MQPERMAAFGINQRHNEGLELGREAAIADCPRLSRLLLVRFTGVNGESNQRWTRESLNLNWQN